MHPVNHYEGIQASACLLLVRFIERITSLIAGSQTVRGEREGGPSKPEQRVISEWRRESPPDRVRSQDSCERKISSRPGWPGALADQRPCGSRHHRGRQFGQSTNIRIVENACASGAFGNPSGTLDGTMTGKNPLQKDTI